MKEVIWKEIAGFEGLYQISNYGVVESLPRWVDGRHLKDGTIVKRFLKGKILTPYTTNGGYYVYCLCKDNKRKVLHAHRGVAEAFIENPDNRTQINHIDGDKLNNSVDNLEWVTAKENMEHASETGLLKGRDNSVVLEYADAVRIRHLYETGQATQIQLSDEYGITQAHCCNICAYRTWKTDKEKNRTNKLSMKEARQMRKMWASGEYTVGKLAIHFNCTLAKVMGVIKNKTFLEK